MNWSNSGFADALLGRKAQSPDNWPDATAYMRGFWQGLADRNKYNIKLTYERQES